MALAQALVSGSWRISSTSGLFTQSFSATTTVSATMALDFVVATGVSDFVVSLATFSNATVVGLQANNQVRINFGGIGNSSYVSNASAGFFITQFAWVTGGTSGPLSLRVANSGTDSATVRLILCTS